MKNIKYQLIITIFLAFAVLPLAAFCQKTPGFEISGHIDGLKDGEKVLLCHFKRYVNENAIRDDSCFVKNNGDFYLRGKTSENAPEEYIVAFDQSVKHRLWVEALHKNVGGACVDLFLADGDKIRIKGGDINKLQNNYFEDEVTVEGSPTMAARAALKPLFQNIDQGFMLANIRLQKITDSIGFDRALIQEQIEKKDKLDQVLNSRLSRFTNRAYKIVAMSLALDVLGDYHGSFYRNLYESLDDEAKASPDGQLLAKRMKLVVGQPMPEFTLPTPEGKMVALKEEIAKNKITVVRFWDTHMYELSHGIEEKELRVFYNKYHDKGLNVIAVSADADKEDWSMRANGTVMRDWINVSDLKGYGKGTLIGETYIIRPHQYSLTTTNVILDGNGRIISWGVIGGELQWYLMKYLENN